MEQLDRALQWASKLLVFFAGLSIVLMMLHVCADVLLDNFVGRPIPGTAEIVAYYYMGAAVFLPLPLVEFRNAGINVDLFYSMAGPRVRRAMLMLAYLAQALFFATLAWQSGDDAIQAFLKSEFVEARVSIPIWPGRFYLPVAFAVGSLVSILLLARTILNPAFDPDDMNSDDIDGINEGAA